MTPHHEIAEIAFVCLAGLTCGLVMLRLRQPALIGYILAGVVLGPSGFALITSREAIALLAELGVTLLLFVLGMELSLRAFRAIYQVALGVMLFQVAFGLGAMALVGQLFDWPVNRIVVLGFAVALSSTAVGIKMLEDIGELRTGTGRLAVGVLIAQDLAIVPMLLIVNGMGSEEGLGIGVLVPIAMSIGVLGVTVWFLSRRERVSIPFSSWIPDHSNLTVVAALTFCLLFARPQARSASPPPSVPSWPV